MDLKLLIVGAAAASGFSYRWGRLYLFRISSSFLAIFFIRKLGKSKSGYTGLSSFINMYNVHVYYDCDAGVSTFVVLRCFLFNALVLLQIFHFYFSILNISKF